jgi:broad specificity phosphatase PhoE
METLILCRHGESVYSAKKRANGDPSVLVPLTQKGRQQAWHARELLRVEIECCVVSKFLRTIETADLALAGRWLPHQVETDLDDIRYGDFEGESLETVHRWLEAHGATEPFPGGGESRADIARRCERAARALLRRPERTILAVTHEHLIATILNAAAGKTLPPAGEHLPYATPYHLSRPEVERAIEVLARS